MKKNFIYVAIACATTFAFVSCGNKESKPVEDAAAAVEELKEEVKAAVEINSADQALDEYEKFIVDEYIPVMKSAAAGDMSAVGKLQEVNTKFQAIAEKFSDASNFTEAQIKRFEEITEKITDAVQ